jgi:predicted Rossmann fold flavoprotein
VTSADLDVAIIGAGAAGLATAIFAKTRQPALRIAVLDGARKPGAKILVSGGSRCNVTNTVVTEADFNGGKPSIVRNILRALPVKTTVEFFSRIGVPLHEEPGGKLFPDSHQSATVLSALLRELERCGVSLRAAHRVTGISREHDLFTIATSAGTLTARAVVLATGGLSLPKTGSDGWGYGAAEAFGHTLVTTTPALAPLLVDDDHTLSGVAHPARLDLRVNGAVATRVSGSLLWTHFGLSGPAALDMSRHWLRAQLDPARPTIELTMSLCPDETFEKVEAAWLSLARARPKLSVQSATAERLPASVAAEVLRRCGISGEDTLAGLTRDARRALCHRLLSWPVPVRDSRGYNYAEVTAGGVDLAEIDPASMMSRRVPGLYLVGEILDVDGRIGGFNFQWAWSSARVAGEAIGRVNLNASSPFQPAPG